MLIIKGFIDFGSQPQNIANSEAFNSHIGGFSKGFTEGYLTMDAIGAIAYSMIVVNAVKATGVKHANAVFKQTLMASIIATIALAFIYISLGYIGNHMTLSQETLQQLTKNNQNVGVHLLVTMGEVGFGVLGKYMLGLIITLACLTTACGLIVSISEYFHIIFPKLSYKAYVCIFTLFSFVLANLGLNSVIQLSVPVLSIIYPIAITTVVLILIARFIPTRRITQQITIIVITIESILSVMNTNGWIHLNFFDKLPLYNISLEWLPIAIVTLIVTYIIGAGIKSSKIIVYEKNN